METTLRWADNSPDESRTSRWLIGSIVLHVALAASIAAIAIIHPSLDHWGKGDQTAGAIQASMVDSLPIAPRPNYDEKSILASEEISPAPIQNKVATVEQPKPDTVPIPIKTPVKPPKTAEKPAPAVLHPQPTPAPPTKAVSGESAGAQIPQVVEQVQHGTVTAAVQDANFGNRYAYYARLIEQTVAKNWYSSQVDPGPSVGKRVTITFEVSRDGTPTNPRILTASGSASLDSSAIQAVRRTDGFGPLPSGDHLNVQYTFDYHQ